MTSTLTARCARSDGWWAIDVPEVPGLFTQARRLDQVATAVLDAAALLTGHPEADVDVTVVPVLDEDNLTLVHDARERRAAPVEAERGSHVGF